MQLACQGRAVTLIRRGMSFVVGVTDAAFVAVRVHLLLLPLLFCVAGEENGNCGIGYGGIKGMDVVPMPHPATQFA